MKKIVLAVALAFGLSACQNLSTNENTAAVAVGSGLLAGALTDSVGVGLATAVIAGVTYNLIDRNDGICTYRASDGSGRLVKRRC